MAERRMRTGLYTYVNGADKMERQTYVEISSELNNLCHRVDGLEDWQKRQNRVELYSSIVNNNRSQEKFLRGWLNRVFKLKQQAGL